LILLVQVVVVVADKMVLTAVLLDRVRRQIVVVFPVAVAVLEVRVSVVKV
jgi:hypothetical protein